MRYIIYPSIYLYSIFKTWPSRFSFLLLFPSLPLPFFPTLVIPHPYPLPTHQHPHAHPTTTAVIFLGEHWHVGTLTIEHLTPPTTLITHAQAYAQTCAQTSHNNTNPPPPGNISSRFSSLVWIWRTAYIEY